MFNYPIPEKTARIILGYSTCFENKAFITDRSVNLPKKDVSPLRIKNDKSSSTTYYIPKTASAINNDFGCMCVYDFSPTYRIDNSDLVIGDEIKLITSGERVGYPLLASYNRGFIFNKSYSSKIETIKLTKELIDEIMKTHIIASPGCVNRDRPSETVASLLGNVKAPIGQIVASGLNLKVYGNAIIETNDLMVIVTDKGSNWLMGGAGEHLVIDDDKSEIIDSGDLHKYEDQITALFNMGRYPNLVLCIPKGYTVDSLIELLGLELRPYHFKIRDIILHAWKELPDWMKTELFTEDGKVVDITDLDYDETFHNLLSSIETKCRSVLSESIDLDKHTEEGVVYHLIADDGYDTGIYILGTGDRAVDGLPMAFLNDELNQVLEVIKGHDKELEMILEAGREY